MTSQSTDAYAYTHDLPIMTAAEFEVVQEILVHRMSQEECDVFERIFSRVWPGYSMAGITREFLTPRQENRTP